MTDYYALFGVPAPEKGENEQEAAAPASVNDDSGENEQETAAPAVETSEEPEAGETAGETTEQENTEEAETQDASEEEPKPQNAEERRKQAAKRKEQEERKRQEDLQKLLADERKQAKQERDKLVAEILEFTGVKTKDGETVKTVEQYEQLLADQKKRKLERDLRAGKLTTEGLQQALAEMPQIKEALESAKRAQEQASSETFTARREMELAEIRKVNPDISTIDDILRMDTGKKFAEAVRKGNSFVDAYYLANREDMLRKQREAGRQAARNEAAGKRHLQATTQESRGGTVVTDRDRKMYRLFNPDMTDAQIARAIEKNKSKE